LAQSCHICIQKKHQQCNSSSKTAAASAATLEACLLSSPGFKQTMQQQHQATSASKQAGQQQQQQQQQQQPFCHPATATATAVESGIAAGTTMHFDQHLQSGFVCDLGLPPPVESHKKRNIQLGALLAASSGQGLWIPSWNLPVALSNRDLRVAAVPT